MQDGVKGHFKNLISRSAQISEGNFFRKLQNAISGTYIVEGIQSSGCIGCKNGFSVPPFCLSRLVMQNEATDREIIFAYPIYAF